MPFPWSRKVAHRLLAPAKILLTLVSIAFWIIVIATTFRDPPGINYGRLTLFVVVSFAVPLVLALGSGHRSSRHRTSNLNSSRRTTS